MNLWFFSLFDGLDNLIEGIDNLYGRLCTLLLARYRPSTGGIGLDYRNWGRLPPNLIPYGTPYIGPIDADGHVRPRTRFRSDRLQ